MNYAIIGFGKIGQALAKAFARNGIEVSVATTRDPKSFAAAAAAIGPTIIPEKLAEAVKADVVFLAVGFRAYQDVAKTLPSWQGKTIVDVTNAYGVPPGTGGTTFCQGRRAGLHWRQAGQGLQSSARWHSWPGSGRTRWQESRVPGERR
jgi:predicted dinucleotide-binding enzyme